MVFNYIGILEFFGEYLEIINFGIRMFLVILKYSYGCFDLEGFSDKVD